MQARKVYITYTELTSFLSLLTNYLKDNKDTIVTILDINVRSGCDYSGGTTVAPQGCRCDHVRMGAERERNEGGMWTDWGQTGNRLRAQRG